VIGPLLLILLVASVVSIVFGSPGRWLTLILILAAALSVGGMALLFLPEPLTPAQKNAVGAAAACATFLVGYLAIPGIRPSEPEKSTTSNTGASSNSASPSATASSSPAPSEVDPFTANLKFGPRESTCEGFIFDKKLLRSISKPKDVNAEWVYENGGATSFGKMILTIQGKSQSAVVIDALRIVDLERHPAPPHAVEVLPCDPEGGLQTVRFFEVDLGKRPKVMPRPSDPLPPDDKPQPAAKFPFKVSRSDPEVFELWVEGPECLCAWRLAIDWTSGGQSRTTFLDHGFDKIKTNTTRGLPGYYYDRDEGWVPPLPT
jgi:hypothetical protein